MTNLERLKAEMERREIPALLVSDIDGASFQVQADEVARPEERHEGCACCA